MEKFYDKLEKCFMLAKQMSKLYRNAGLPKFLKNNAIAFRHQGESGTGGKGLVRHCPVMKMNE
jgi:hypothetical protein